MAYEPDDYPEKNILEHRQDFPATIDTPIDKVQKGKTEHSLDCDEAVIQKAFKLLHSYLLFVVVLFLLYIRVLITFRTEKKIT